MYDPVTGVFTILGPGSTTYTVSGFLPGDIPAPADYLGNGSTQPVVFRPTTGQFVGAGGAIIATFGQSGDIPLAAPLSYRMPSSDPPTTGNGNNGNGNTGPGTTGMGTTGTGNTGTGTTGNGNDRDREQQVGTAQAPSKFFYGLNIAAACTEPWIRSYAPWHEYSQEDSGETPQAKAGRSSQETGRAQEGQGRSTSCFQAEGSRCQAQSHQGCHGLGFGRCQSQIFNASG